MPAAAKSNESLASRLQKAEVYDEFCSLMFGQDARYEDLLEQLEKWGISSSLGALTRFSDSQLSIWTLDRAKREYEQMLNEAGTTLDAAQKKIVAERLYNLAASPNISDKTLLKMRDQEIKLAEMKNTERSLDQRDEQLRNATELVSLQRRKIEMLEAREKETKEDLGNNTLTDEERAARMRARFGV